MDRAVPDTARGRSPLGAERTPVGTSGEGKRRDIVQAATILVGARDVPPKDHHAVAERIVDRGVSRAGQGQEWPQVQVTPLRCAIEREAPGFAGREEGVVVSA